MQRKTNKTNKRGVSNAKFETPKKFDKGIVRFEEKSSLFVACGVQKYVEPRKRLFRFYQM